MKIIFFFYFLTPQSLFSEFELQRVECLNKTVSGKIMDFMIEVNRVDRYTYAIEGDIAIDPKNMANHQVKNNFHINCVKIILSLLYETCRLKY